MCFECIRIALELKHAATKCAENEMEVDRTIDGEDDEEMSDGEPCTSDHNMVRITHALFPSFFAVLRLFCLSFDNLSCLRLSTGQ